MDKDIIEFECLENKIFFLKIYLFKDMALDDIFRSMTFQILKDNIQIKGTMFQILDVGPRSYFMKCRK